MTSLYHLVAGSWQTANQFLPILSFVVVNVLCPEWKSSLVLIFLNLAHYWNIFSLDTKPHLSPLSLSLPLSVTVWAQSSLLSCFSNLSQVFQHFNITPFSFQLCISSLFTFDLSSSFWSFQTLSFLVVLFISSFP